MYQPTPDPCAICERATGSYYQTVDSDNLNESHSYNICMRSDCALLGSDIANFLAEEPYNEFSFDEVLHEVQRRRPARLPGTKTKIDDWSEGNR